MTTLTNEDKLGVVNQHIKNAEFNKYNIELSLIEENAVASPDANTVSSLNTQLTAINAKLAALEAEKDSLTE